MCATYCNSKDCPVSLLSYSLAIIPLMSDRFPLILGFSLSSFEIAIRFLDSLSLAGLSFYRYCLWKAIGICSSLMCSKLILPFNYSYIIYCTIFSIGGNCNISFSVSASTGFSPGWFASQF